MNQSSQRYAGDDVGVLETARVVSGVGWHEECNCCQQDRKEYRTMKTPRIEIVSGEGTGEGTVELWTATLNVPAIRGRLTRERCNGDRWAYCQVDGQRVEDSDIGDAIIDAQESTIAGKLEKLEAHTAMVEANKICPESKRDQNWEMGATTYEFQDGSQLQVCGAFVKELHDDERVEI